MFLIPHDCLWNLAVEAVRQLFHGAHVASSGLLDELASYPAQVAVILCGLCYFHAERGEEWLIALLSSTIRVCHLDK
jgi:hypothetical protein